MSNVNIDLNEFHWLMDMIQSVDIGLVVLDVDYRIHVWNTFMENHSNKSTNRVHSKVIFDLFPDTPMEWIRKKIDTVFQLNNRAFSSWEQRSFLFKFNNYRPITGTEPFMYQNISIIPLSSTDGKVNHVCLIIYDVTDIASQRKELDAINTQLKTLLRTDPLTLLSNRNYWNEGFELEFNQFQRNQLPRTLILFDIDHFKNINDLHGHPAGDWVIQKVAAQLRSSQRNTDFSGRYGGDRFVIILSNVTERSSRIFAERLRKSIEKMSTTYDNKELRVSISLGIAELDNECVNKNIWFERADKALSYAKNNGRNRSVLYSAL